MTVIGTAALQVIPSLDGFSAAVDRQLGGTLKSVGTRGGKQFGAGMVSGLKATEADVKKAFDNHAKLADKAADATGKLKVAQAGYDELVNKGITTGKRFEAAKAAAAKASRDEARALKTATDALKDYERAAEDAKSSGEKASTGFLSGLRGVASGAGSAGSEAAAGFAEGFSGSSALLRLGSVGGPVGIAVAAAGTVLGGVLWKNLEAGIEREPGRDLIQARLGATTEDMKAIGKASGAAYANNFGDSLQSNFQASQLAIQGGLVTGALDPALQGVTEKLQAISQYVGGELTDVTKSVSILMRSGMASSAEEAFDIIATGYKVTGDLGADWLDSIGEYSSGWKNAGFTAEQALALIKQAQDNGVDVTDRSADALREFGRRISEEGPKMVQILDAIGLNGQDMYDKFKKGGPEAFNAFDQVFDKIRSLKDPVDRNNAALAILGDTAGDFVEAFAKWDPSAAVTSLGDVSGAAQNASNIMGDNTKAAFEEARRSVEVSIDGIQDSLALTFAPALKSAAAWAQEHTADIASAFKSLVGVAIDVGSSILEAVGEITEAIGQLVGGIGNIQGTVLKFESWQADIRGDHELAKQLHEQSEEAYGWGDSLEAAGTSMRNAATDMKTWKDKLGDITSGTQDADTAVSGLGTSVQGLGDAFKNMPAALPGWFPNVTGGGAPSGPGWFGGFGQSGGGLPASAGAPGSLDDLVATGGGGRGVGINLQANAQGGGQPYALPAGSNSNGYGGDGVKFPDWVYQLGQTFNLKPSTYPGHQEDRGQGNQGIDWTGSVEDMQRFAEYLASIKDAPGLEDVIWQNPNTGQPIGVNKGRLVGTPGSDDPGYFRRGHNDFADHQNHVHTTQEQSLPVPGAGTPIPAALSSNTTAAPSTLTASSAPDDVAASIIAQAQQRGFTREQTIAVLSTAMQESGLSPSASGGGGAWHGIFQQDKSYPGRDDPNTNISTFLDRLGAPSDDIWAQIFGLQQGTPLGAPGARTGYLSEIQSKAGVAAASYDRLAGSGAAAGPGVSPNLTNAYGAGYKPGIGTPGVNEYGEQGYYQTDPRRISQAARSADDAVDHIAEADQALADSNKDLADAVKERDSIAQLSEVQRIAQGKDLDKANADVERLQKQVDRNSKEAGRSREDADWAQQDLAEAQQGTFKSAQKDSSSGKGGKGLSLPSTFSGFGSAIGEFAGGQIGSALDVFGIGDSPPFLQAASQLLGGIKVGGHDPSGVSDGSLFDGGNMFGGAAPLSAAGAGGAAVADGSQHGTLAGQAPGPVYNTTIQARDAEGAMEGWQRLQNQRMAAKTSVY